MGPAGTSLPRCSGDSLALSASPLGLLPFGRDLQGFPAPDHPVRGEVGFYSTPLRDGLPELLCLLWPPSSGLGHAERSHGAVSRARLRSGCVGSHPLTSTPSAAGPCSRTPPRLRKFPCTGGETCITPAIARGRRPFDAGASEDTAESYDRAGCAGFPALPGGSAGGNVHIAVHPSIGSIDALPATPAWGRARSSRIAFLLLPSLLRVVPPRLRSGQLVRWVPCRPHWRASTPGELPPLRQVGATRPVVFRPRGSIPTSAAYSAHQLPGFCTWYRHDFAGFHPRAPADLTRLPGPAR